MSISQKNELVSKNNKDRDDPERRSRALKVAVKRCQEKWVACFGSACRPAAAGLS